MSDKTKDILEWVYCIVIALILALLFRYFIATPTIVKQKSMFPTLKENQRLILNRTIRITNKEPEIGDIITFQAPSHIYNEFDADQSNPIAKYENDPKGIFKKFVFYVLEMNKKSYIKRVIAKAGDHVVIKDNEVWVNNVKQEESYLQDDVITESAVFNDFIVPEGYIFAMGDNRPNSTDCRDIGCIPLDKVEGIVILRFWPFNLFGKVE